MVGDRLAAALDAGALQLNSASQVGTEGSQNFRVLWEDDYFVFCRGWRQDIHGNRSAVLAVRPIGEHPPAAVLDRLDHEYGLRDELDSAWAVRPLEFVRELGRTMLVLEDPGGEPLYRLLDSPVDVETFLRLAVHLTAAIGELHQRGIVHKDIKPQHIIVSGGDIKLTGFGIASRLPRERQPPQPPEFIAGTLAYMAPEQTGRMNRSIDSRSDLYALGVTLYQMLTGQLPFNASDPMEWVHCHIARQPVTPAERRTDIPNAVSAIVMKLLAKTAEERYQTAAGLGSDLRRCLAEWEAQRRIDDFQLGERDSPNRVLFAEKLYGREREVEALLGAFDRVIKNGAPELVLVSGYAGIGKSSVVNELHKVLVPPRALFASGKFDQYKRDIPYATLAQAFQILVRNLLGKSDAELIGWRKALRQSLGPNVQLMADLVPQLSLLIEDLPPVPELPPQESQRRFQMVFRRFISVFARPEHPLVLFLDDLQWLDAATLDLLEDLLTRSDPAHLLLIGAYRNNEVSSTHPLTRKVNAIQTAGGKVAEITVAPLGPEQLGELIADALRCGPEHTAPLAQLIHEKTGGNPFFAIQFTSSLAEEGMLTFDHDAARWSWDLGRINAKEYTDNVADLIAGKLTRLPNETQQALQQLACLGNTTEIATLSIVLGISEEEARAALWPAVRQELVEPFASAYRFAHDHIQEAAYSLIPEELRDKAHLRIGRVLTARTPAEKREEAIFEIVNQLNRGASLITAPEEREELAEFNLIAGKRAKASTAYTSALTYLTAGAGQLPEDCWEHCPELVFSLELNRAECEFLTGALVAAEERLATLLMHSKSTVERAAVACLRVDLYVTLGEGNRAVDVGIEYLRHLGIDWSPHPSDEDIRREYERIWSQIGSRAIEELLDLPLTSSAASLATLEVLIRIVSPAWFADSNLFCLVSCRAVNLSLEQGNCDSSCFAYVLLGVVAGSRFGDYQAGFRFGRLGYDLVEHRGLKRFQGKAYNFFGTHVLPWTKYVRTGRDILRRALEIAHQGGDPIFAVYCYANLNSNYLTAADPLIDTQRQVEIGLEYAQEAHFVFGVVIMTTHRQLVRTLRGLTFKFGSFDDGEFDESQTERRFSDNSDLALAEWAYWSRKMQARFYACDYASAFYASQQAQRLLWTSSLLFETAECHFFSALSRAAYSDAAAAGELQHHLQALIAHHRRLEIWTEQCPENFENRAALVGAEIARIESRDVDAMRLYDQAVRSARAGGFVQNEALANELAARFYAARGFDTITRTYLRNARHCYVRWGAEAKVRQLDEMYPNLKEVEPASTPTVTIGVPIEHLDLATVIKVSQAVSGEMALERLIDTLMSTAMVQAGAERAVLILASGADPRIAAEATTNGDSVAVDLRDEPLTAAMLPESVLRYVLRSGESVIFDDASAQSSAVTDPYIVQRHARSLLCLPLLNQAKLIGVLYLENNLAPRVFAPARITVLKLLASQAAISLENTRLYCDLAEREAKIRRLVEANIIGIFIRSVTGDVDGPIVEANDAFLRMVGYDREDLISGRITWAQLAPPEWRDADARAVAELKKTGILPAYEKEYFRKDGSRVPVLVGAATLENGTSGVAFVLDLTERKRAAEVISEMQAALAYATRVTTMGQLTASIAHEISQPITSAVINARAGLRWLGAHPPDLQEVQQAFEGIVQDGERAGEVLDRIRGLVKKAPPRKDIIAINDVILDVIALTRSEVIGLRASLHTDLSTDLPLIEADRVQLQQVILNLIVNACEAMRSNDEPTRELWISSKADGPNGVLVAVRDTGPGLDPTSIDRLFEPFYTTKSEGMGVGLSISRSIVQAHGGQLWASANEPRGAIFQFTVPTHLDSTS